MMMIIKAQVSHNQEYMVDIKEIKSGLLQIKRLNSILCKELILRGPNTSIQFLDANHQFDTTHVPLLQPSTETISCDTYTITKNPNIYFSEFEISSHKFLSCRPANNVFLAKILGEIQTLENILKNLSKYIAYKESLYVDKCLYNSLCSTGSAKHDSFVESDMNIWNTYINRDENYNIEGTPIFDVRSVYLGKQILLEIREDVRKEVYNRQKRCVDGKPKSIVGCNDNNNNNNIHSFSSWDLLPCDIWTTILQYYMTLHVKPISEKRLSFTKYQYLDTYFFYCVRAYLLPFHQVSKTLTKQILPFIDNIIDLLQLQNLNLLHKHSLLASTIPTIAWYLYGDNNSLVEWAISNALEQRRQRKQQKYKVKTRYDMYMTGGQDDIILDVAPQTDYKQLWRRMNLEKYKDSHMGIRMSEIIYALAFVGNVECLSKIICSSCCGPDDQTALNYCSQRLCIKQYRSGIVQAGLLGNQGAVVAKWLSPRSIFISTHSSDERTLLKNMVNRRCYNSLQTLNENKRWSSVQVCKELPLYWTIKNNDTFMFLHFLDFCWTGSNKIPWTDTCHGCNVSTKVPFSRIVHHMIYNEQYEMFRHFREDFSGITSSELEDKCLFYSSRRFLPYQEAWFYNRQTMGIIIRQLALNKELLNLVITLQDSKRPIHKKDIVKILRQYPQHEYITELNKISTENIDQYKNIMSCDELYVKMVYNILKEREHKILKFLIWFYKCGNTYEKKTVLGILLGFEYYGAIDEIKRMYSSKVLYLENIKHLFSNFFNNERRHGFTKGYPNKKYRRNYNHVLLDNTKVAYRLLGANYDIYFVECYDLASKYIKQHFTLYKTDPQTDIFDKVEEICSEIAVLTENPFVYI